MAVACLLISLPIAVRWSYRQVFFESHEFPLKRIQIETNGSLTEAMIAETAGLEAGEDMMGIDIQAVQKRLEALPSVMEAVISRAMPGRICIRVKERVPIAWLSCPPQGISPLSVEHGFLIDETGNVFRCLEMREDNKSLPVIESLDMARPKEGSIVESKPIRRAISMVTKSERMFESVGMQISEVKLKSSWAMKCVYRNGMRVTFSMDDIDRGLRDLKEIVRVLGDGTPRLATINLVVSKNIPVTFEGSVDRSDFQDFLRKRDVSDKEEESPVEAARERQLRAILRGG